jgi:putative transposase
MEFRFFDPRAKTEITQGSLPHWEQLNAYYFITWRTADSLPTALLQRWQLQRDEWLRAHGIDPLAEDWQRELEMLPEIEHREFYTRFTAQWNALLDEGHGECVLRQPELSSIVEDSLLHFDGVRYALEAYVVMPNHVHVVAGISGRGEMSQLCRSWKNFTAMQINKALGRQGQFWQWESFDHLVRSPASLEKFRNYILKNPIEARLRDGEYRVWAKPK